MTKALAISLVLSAGILCGQEFKLGSHVSDFQVRDLDGKTAFFTSLSYHRGAVHRHGVSGIEFL
jgi:hypothetical protein